MTANRPVIEYQVGSNLEAHAVMRHSCHNIHDRACRFSSGGDVPLRLGAIGFPPRNQRNGSTVVFWTV